MKHLVLSLAALFAFAGSGNARSSETAPKGDSDDIVILTEIKPGEETPVRTRSAVPDVSAYIDYELAQLEIAFNTCVGKARIEIVDGWGRCVHSSSCDTEMEPAVWISLPSVAADYVLKIDTSSAVYTRAFSL